MRLAIWMLLWAPWYEAAILLASVSPVANRFQWMKMPPPITCVTAIASPIARPRPRISAAAIPPRAYGNTTPRTISQRVVPSASAPSFSSRGTPRKSSRLMLEMIGRIMIVSTTIAVKMLEPVAAGSPKSGMKPSTSWSARLDVVAEDRAEDEDAPEPDHDARDRRERLDERGDRRRGRGAAQAR